MREALLPQTGGRVVGLFGLGGDAALPRARLPALPVLGGEPGAAASPTAGGHREAPVGRLHLVQKARSSEAKDFTSRVHGS